MPVKPKPSTPDYFNFDERALVMLADAYGLDGADAFYPILLDGETCTLLEVRSATSRKMMLEDRGRRLFLKEIPWYANDPGQLAWSHALQLRLADEGAPVARIVPSRSG